MTSNSTKIPPIRQLRHSPNPVIIGNQAETPDIYENEKKPDFLGHSKYSKDFVRFSEKKKQLPKTKVGKTAHQNLLKIGEIANGEIGQRMNELINEFGEKQSETNQVIQTKNKDLTSQSAENMRKSVQKIAAKNRETALMLSRSANFNVKLKSSKVDGDSEMNLHYSPKSTIKVVSARNPQNSSKRASVAIRNDQQRLTQTARSQTNKPWINLSTQTNPKTTASLNNPFSQYFSPKCTDSFVRHVIIDEKMRQLDSEKVQSLLKRSQRNIGDSNTKKGTNNVMGATRTSDFTLSVVDGTSTNQNQPLIQQEPSQEIDQTVDNPEITESATKVGRDISYLLDNKKPSLPSYLQKQQYSFIKNGIGNIEEHTIQSDNLRGMHLSYPKPLRTEGLSGCSPTGKSSSQILPAEPERGVGAASARGVESFPQAVKAFPCLEVSDPSLLLSLQKHIPFCLLNYPSSKAETKALRGWFDGLYESYDKEGQGTKQTQSKKEDLCRAALAETCRQVFVSHSERGILLMDCIEKYVTIKKEQILEKEDEARKVQTEYESRIEATRTIFGKTLGQKIFQLEEVQKELDELTVKMEAAETKIKEQDIIMNRLSSKVNFFQAAAVKFKDSTVKYYSLVDDMKAMIRAEKNWTNKEFEDNIKRFKETTTNKKINRSHSLKLLRRGPSILEDDPSKQPAESVEKPDRHLTDSRIEDTSYSDSEDQEDLIAKRTKDAEDEVIKTIFGGKQADLNLFINEVGLTKETVRKLDKQVQTEQYSMNVAAQTNISLANPKFDCLFENNTTVEELAKEVEFKKNLLFDIDGDLIIEEDFINEDKQEKIYEKIKDKLKTTNLKDINLGPQNSTLLQRMVSNSPSNKEKNPIKKKPSSEEIQNQDLLMSFTTHKQPMLLSQGSMMEDYGDYLMRDNVSLVPPPLPQTKSYLEESPGEEDQASILPAFSQTVQWAKPVPVPSDGSSPAKNPPLNVPRTQPKHMKPVINIIGPGEAPSPPPLGSADLTFQTGIVKTNEVEEEPSEPNLKRTTSEPPKYEIQNQKRDSMLPNLPIASDNNNFLAVKLDDQNLTPRNLDINNDSPKNRLSLSFRSRGSDFLNIHQPAATGVSFGANSPNKPSQPYLTRSPTEADISDPDINSKKIPEMQDKMFGILKQLTFEINKNTALASSLKKSKENVSGKQIEISDLNEKIRQLRLDFENRMKEIDYLKAENYRLREKGLDSPNYPSSPEPESPTSPTKSDRKARLQKRKEKKMLISQKMNRDHIAYNQTKARELISLLNAGRFAMFKNPMSLKFVMKTIWFLIIDRVKDMTQKPESKQVPFAEYVYTYYTQAFGLDMCQKKFTFFILSLKYHGQYFRVNLFSRFMGMIEQHRYEEDIVLKYFEGIEFLEKSQKGFPVKNSDTAVRVLYPYIRADEFLKIVFEDKISTKEFHDFRQTFEKLKEPDPQGLNLALIDADIFLERVIERYSMIVNRNKQYMIDAFKACDLDGNNSCSVNEFLILNRFIEPKRFDLTNCVKWFFDNADLIDPKETNMSFDKFAVVCTNLNLFSEKSQNEFLGIKSSSEAVELFDTLKKGWDSKYPAFCQSLENFESLTPEEIKNWMEILSVLNERMRAENTIEFKPTCIAYLMTEKEFDRIKEEDEYVENEDDDISKLTTLKKQNEEGSIGNSNRGGLISVFKAGP